MSTISLFYTLSEGACPYEGWNINIRHQFDASAYAEHEGINVADIDADDIKAVQDAQSQLGVDSWLTVEHR